MWVRVTRSIAMDVLHEFSLSWVRNLLSRGDITSNNWSTGRYSVFTVEPFRLFHLGICKKFKECTVSYVSSPELETNFSLPKKYREKLICGKNRLLKGCNNLLPAHENEILVFRLQIDFSTLKMTSTLNGFLQQRVWKWCRKNNFFRALDMLFPFICAFLNRATGHRGQLVLTETSKIHI